MTIPFIDLRSQFLLIEKDLNQTIQNVFDHGKFINGPEVQEFESKLCEYTGAKHAVTCANGTDALTIALLALELKPNDAIFVPSFTYIASVEAISLIGGMPYFIDVGEDYNICPDSLEAAIADSLKNNHNPRIVIPVDLFGKPAISEKLDSLIMEYSLKVIYDSAQSFGSSYSNKKIANFGDITTTSFFPAKPLGCYGDGGAIFTNNDELAKLIRSIKNHGMGSHKYEHINVGMNSRLDTLQAAILIEKLKLLDKEIISRNHIARQYSNLLCDTDLILPKLSENDSFAWAQYTVRHQDRDKIMSRLSSAGVPTAIYYPIPLNKQKAYKDCHVVSTGIPNTERFCNEVFSLPMSPYLNEKDQRTICDAIKGIV